MGKEIMKIERIGSVTTSVLVAVIGDSKIFKNRREASARLGLVPKQYSSGNKTPVDYVNNVDNSLLVPRKVAHIINVGPQAEQ
jgi:transposase